MGQVIQFSKKQDSNNYDTERISPKEQFIEDIMPFVLEKMVDYGYNITDDFRIKDIALIVESLNAAMNRAEGKYHGLHAVSNKINISG